MQKLGALSVWCFRSPSLPGLEAASLDATLCSKIPRWLGPEGVKIDPPVCPLSLSLDRRHMKFKRQADLTSVASQKDVVATELAIITLLNATHSKIAIPQLSWS